MLVKVSGQQREGNEPCLTVSYRYLGLILSANDVGVVSPYRPDF